jgi:hypothetical protein
MATASRRTARKKNALAERMARTAAFLVLRSEGRLILAAVLVLAALPAAVYWGWKHAGPRVLASADYQLGPAQIELVPPQDSAPWIRRSDVKREALADAGLSGSLSLLDDALIERIHQAFKLHPWVASVDRVTKDYPARVTVHLTYRRPVAIAVVADDNWWPVDAEGYVLRQHDFSPVPGDEYAQIGGLTSGPPRPPGERWGDERVASAARIAAVLGGEWKELELGQIVPRAATGADSEAFFYDLVTKRGRRIVWGRALDVPGEVPAAEKIARLKRYKIEHGSLDASDEAIDLTSKATTYPPRE